MYIYIYIYTYIYIYIYIYIYTHICDITIVILSMRCRFNFIARLLCIFQGTSSVEYYLSLLKSIKTEGKPIC